MWVSLHAHNRVKDDRHTLRTLRAMTGAIIVYDHTNTTGAFCSKSEIKVTNGWRDFRIVHCEES